MGPSSQEEAEWGDCSLRSRVSSASEAAGDQAHEHEQHDADG